MPLSYSTQVRGLQSYKTPLASHPHTYTTVFTLITQTIGLILAYLLGIIFNYNNLIITACSVSANVSQWF